MTNEELQALGLNDEQVKGVMALKGKVVEQEQTKAKTEAERIASERDELAKELNGVKKDLKDFGKLSSDNEELAAKLKEKEDALSASEEARVAADTKYKFDAALAEQAKSLNFRNPEDLKRFVDIDKLVLKDDNTFDGLDEQITTLQQNNSYLFDGGTKAGYTPATGGAPTKEVSSLKDAVADFYG